MRVIWSRRAAADVFEIADYYDRIDPDLALDMVDRVKDVRTRLIDNPRIGPALDEEPGVRKWLVPGTPFLLLYAIREEMIEIRRVRHATSDWRRTH